ncbi:MAG: dTMP kinase [Acidobacteriota bacterium]
MKLKGKLITFEGIEGSGKTTQLERLSAHLQSQNLNPLVTREPGGTDLGDRIRRILLDPAQGAIDPMTELLLYLGIRRQHLREVLVPALEEGRLVLCDRFSDATRAYQGYGRGIPLEQIAELERQAGVDRRPDLTLLLDMEVNPALDRTRRRERQNQPRSRYDREDEAFHLRVREGYLAIARREDGRVHRVDASGTVEETHQRIRTICDRFLSEREGA